MRILLLLSLALVLATIQTNAAEKHWVGGTGASTKLWNKTANWSLSQGGAGNAGVPTTADDVFIDGGTGPCQVNAAASCRSLTISTQSLAFNAAVVLTVGTGGVIISGSTFNLTGGTGLSVAGNWLHSGGTFTPSTIAVTFNGTSSQTIGTETFYGLTLTGAGSKTLTGALTVTGTLTLTSGTFIIGANTLTVQNAIAGTLSNLSAGITSSIAITGAGTGINIPSSIVALNNLTINNANGATLQGPLSLGGTLTLTSGNLTLGANNLTVTGSISGGSASSYVITNGAGSLIRNVSNSSLAFPIGVGATDYTPIAFSNTATARDYSVRVISVTPDSKTGGLNRQWIVKETRPLDNTNTIFGQMTIAWSTAAQGTLTNLAQCDAVANTSGITTSYDPLKKALTITSSSVSFTPAPDGPILDISNPPLYITIVQNNSALPVELSSFTSTVNERAITLNWSTSTEKNSDKFIVEKMNGYSWIEVGAVKAANLSNSVRQYSFTDKNLQAGKYQYRLKMIDNDGTFAYSKVTSAVVSTPKSFELSQNYPNPFNPSTRIGYQIPVDSKVILEVYNIVGQRVAMIVNEEQSAGYYTVNFNSTSYRNITSGVYIYKLTALDNAGKNSSSIKKMMLLK